jgi:hypothetical protein
MNITSLGAEDPTVVGRYLAGQLSDAERAAFEERLERDPAVLHELEATARLKVGLAKLRETGELDALLAPPPWYQRNLTLATAAMLAIVVLGVLLVRLGPVSSQPPLLAASAGSLVDQQGSALAITSTLAVFRKRVDADDAIIESSPTAAAVELRVLPDTKAESGLYEMTLSRIDEDGSLAEVASLADLRPADDGFVTLFIDRSRLEPGRYRLDVLAEGRGSGAADSFVLRVILPRGD